MAGNITSVAAPGGTAAIAKEQVKPVDLLKRVLNAESVKTQFTNAMGKSAPAFLASIIDLFNTDPNLAKCDPNQVVCEALKAAVLKLPINKALGFAYILPYNNSRKDKNGNWVKVMEPAFQMGYKGYIQLAMRTGNYRTINADAVYEGEIKSVNKLTGEIDLSGVRVSDKVLGYFCYFRLLNSYDKTLYMTVEQMAKHAKRYSKGLGRDVTVDSLIALAGQPMDAESKVVGWLGNFHGMALKTVIRLSLSKYGYLSIDMQNAFVDDQEGDTAEIRDNVVQNHTGVTTLDMGQASFQTVDEQPSGESGNGMPAGGGAPVDIDPGY